MALPSPSARIDQAVRLDRAPYAPASANGSIRFGSSPSSGRPLFITRRIVQPFAPC